MERQRDGTYPRAEELVGLCMGFRFGCATTFRSPIHAGVLEHAGVFESVVASDQFPSDCTSASRPDRAPSTVLKLPKLAALRPSNKCWARV